MTEKANRFHCCATCTNYHVEPKNEGKPTYRCSRLGFETKPTYQFHCWNPNEHVRRLMKKEEQNP
ncbi:hypothetical protein [Brevibacillus daliensis]|uniref:hypothetical protein n=1 Tax=Brevibacillus daliensis TaxID=2892995 RepID=UPI001E461D0B|nr:hypothetical protein [Brevibacillus daliensis]